MIRRYSKQFDDYGIIDAAQGEYCRYSDYERLETELFATKEKLEAAEKRIRESQECILYQVWGDGYDGGWFEATHEEYLAEKECDRQILYTMPPIPPELAELKREILDMKETCTALRMGWSEASNESAELRKQLETKA